MEKEQLLRLAKEAGLTEIGELNIAELSYESWVREICQGNTCRNYNTTWACPPAIGTLEECRERCQSFTQMFLFNQVFPVKNCFDIKGMHKAMFAFKETVEHLDLLCTPYIKRRLILSNEGCGRCERCTWPEASCRFPDKLYHSLEGYGFNVTELAKKAGLTYNHGEKTVAFFGAILF